MEQRAVVETVDSLGLEVQWAIRQWLAQQPTSFFASGIHKLVGRWDKV